MMSTIKKSIFLSFALLVVGSVNAADASPAQVSSKQPTRFQQELKKVLPMVQAFGVLRLLDFARHQDPNNLVAVPSLPSATMAAVAAIPTVEGLVTGTSSRAPFGLEKDGKSLEAWFGSLNVKVTLGNGSNLLRSLSETTLSSSTTLGDAVKAAAVYYGVKVAQAKLQK